MKLKDLMHFEAKTYRGKNNNVMPDDIKAFLQTQRLSVSTGKMVKYAEMPLTHFIRSIVVDLEMKDLIKEAS